MYLTSKNGYIFTIDAKDLPMLIGLSYTGIKTKHTSYIYIPELREFLHRYLLNAPSGLEVDHKDRNGLNNCRSNIRICTKAENAQNRRMRSDNTTGIVNIGHEQGRWRVYGYKNGKRVSKGFSSKENAIRAQLTGDI